MTTLSDALVSACANFQTLGKRAASPAERRRYELEIIGITDRICREFETISLHGDRVSECELLVSALGYLARLQNPCDPEWEATRKRLSAAVVEALASCASDMVV